jgi:hypothetical protein
VVRPNQRGVPRARSMRGAAFLHIGIGKSAHHCSRSAVQRTNRPGMGRSDRGLLFASSDHGNLGNADKDFTNAVKDVLKKFYGDAKKSETKEVLEDARCATEFAAA